MRCQELITKSLLFSSNVKSSCSLEDLIRVHKAFLLLCAFSKYIKGDTWLPVMKGVIEMKTFACSLRLFSFPLAASEAAVGCRGDEPG